HLVTREGSARVRHVALLPAAGLPSPLRRTVCPRRAPDPVDSDMPPHLGRQNGTSKGAGMPSGGFGRSVQSAIYAAGAFGHRPLVPTDGTALEAAARKVMSRRGFAYVAGSAGSEATARANREAFDRWQVVPRMLVDTRERDQSVELFGRRHPSPFLVSPIGVLSMAHADADLAVAR